jgi:gentisate 1,2-dioxygenase
MKAKTMTKQTAGVRSKTWGDILEDRLQEAQNEKDQGRIVIKKKDLRWEEDKFVRSAMAVSPLTGFKLKTLHSWFGEILPGAKTGKHRHTSEAIMTCLSGDGYSVIDGKRHEWSEGDVIVMPAMTWHQHFNASTTQPFRFYVATNYPLTENIGLAMIEVEEQGSHHQE